LEHRRDQAADCSPRLATIAFRSWREEAARFERRYQRGAIFDIELGKNMFDVFADGGRLCAQNYADVIGCFCPVKSEEHFGFREAST
jgi:hypothetical protein